jgi:mannose-1-phosphate guanylyltransferase
VEVHLTSEQLNTNAKEISISKTKLLARSMIKNEHKETAYGYISQAQSNMNKTSSVVHVTEVIRLISSCCL